MVFSQPTASIVADFYSDPCNGANMGEVIRFVPKSERERARLIREARAMYDSLFPPADTVSEQQDKAPGESYANTHRSDGVLLP
jgi:hypothetical protein